jgi:hypothetical protein
LPQAFSGRVSISDPIIAKIKKYKVSWAAVAAREPVDANGEPAWGTPGYERCKDENQVVAAKWGDEFMDMLATDANNSRGCNRVDRLLPRTRGGELRWSVRLSSSRVACAAEGVPAKRGVGTLKRTADSRLRHAFSSPH